LPTKIDVLTPIHKGVRSMIYALGGELQSTDFRDPAQTAAVVRQIQHEFGPALQSNCILCLLHQHGGDEEKFAFPRMAEFEPALIEHLLAAHRELGRQLEGLTALGTALERSTDPDERVRRGAELNRVANAFFAAYLAHMNEEEQRLVPAMAARLSDEEVVGLRARTQASMPPDRLAEFLGWTLASLSAPELEELVRGLQRGAPPEALRAMLALAESKVPPARWAAVKSRVSL